MERSETPSAAASPGGYGKWNPNSIVGGALVILAGIFLFYVIPNYINLPPFMQHPLLSPRFLPQLAGWIVLVLATLLLIEGLLHPPEREEAEALRSGVPMLRQGLMVAAGVVYVLFFEQLGAIGSGVLASVLLFLASNLRSPWVYALAIAFPVGVSLLFIHVMNVPLPTGTLWE